ncbi:MAG: DUF45 domain-containing protein [Bacteroidales bacterium]|nr:DUF45 domain-containing protein [Bacteroidales bacterium]
MTAWVKSQHYMDRELGEVSVRVLATARQFTARVRGGIVHLTIPRGVTPEEYNRIFDSMKPRLREALDRVVSPYCDGFRFETSGWSFELRRSEIVPPLHIVSTAKQTDGNIHYVFEYGTGLDFSDTGHARFMSGRISDRARDITLGFIIDRARDIARRLGCRPAGIKVSRGLRVLGHCTSRGVVSLSEKIAFLPDELRDYVITHELAHLTHMDHSADFYALWERYYGRPVAPLRRQLRGFVWPVIG